MTLVKQWTKLCWQMARRPKVCTAGTRRIIRGAQWSAEFDDTLTLTHSGYQEETGSKLKQLERHYLNRGSIDRAVSDYRERIAKGSYGSVGVTTHAEVKEGFTKQGFCIQAFTLTLVPEARGVRKTEVDVFYRTVEVVKKFGADLVFFRDILLPFFDLSEAPLTRVNFHFANLSVHPMFYPLLALTDKDWEDNVLSIKEHDPSLYRSVLRWSNRVLIGKDREKFMQAARVTKGLEDNLSKRRIRQLIKFVNKELEE